MSGWRSVALPALALTAIAAIALSRVSDETRSARQNYYASREDCERDYDARSCRAAAGTSGGYYGPHYSSTTRTANDEGPGRTAVNGRSSAAVNSHPVARGGFGSTGHGYSGG